MAVIEDQDVPTHRVEAKLGGDGVSHLSRPSRRDGLSRGHMSKSHAVLAHRSAIDRAMQALRMSTGCGNSPEWQALGGCWLDPGVTAIPVTRAVASEISVDRRFTKILAATTNTAVLIVEVIAAEQAPARRQTGPIGSRRSSQASISSRVDGSLSAPSPGSAATAGSPETSSG
jgi:hypothetical protein